MSDPTQHLQPAGTTTVTSGPVDPGWAAWSRAWTRHLPTLTGRTDLTVLVAPGAAAPAPACYQPDTRRIEVDAVHIGASPHIADPRRAGHKRVVPTGYGLLVHEAAHAVHTRWEIPGGTPPVVAEAAMLLEESRAEYRQRSRRRTDRRWLRHAVTNLITPDDAPVDDPWHAGKLAGLLLARVDARILTHRDVTAAKAAVTAILGRPRLRALRDLWRQAQQTSDDDTTTMIGLAHRWCSQLGINPDIDPQAPTPDPGIFAGVLAAAITDYLAAAHTSSVADYRAATIATTYRAPTTWTRRDPTDAERRAGRHLATRLAAAHGTPEPDTRPTTTPPGRLRTRHALTAQAQIDAGAIPTATPWQRRTQLPPPRPRLHLAVLVDVSGSMTDYTAPMSSAAWILAHAAHHTHATTATIAFGPTVTLLTPPNSRPQHVLDIHVAGGTDTFTQAIKLADELLHLRRPDTTRLLCVVSDGYLADRDAAQKLLSTLHHTGCRTLWLEPAGHSAPPFADTTTFAVDDPSTAITAIADAACAALAAHPHSRSV
jgi:Mg-chelatase subunit ChlD